MWMSPFFLYSILTLVKRKQSDNVVNVTYNTLKYSVCTVYISTLSYHILFLLDCLSLDVVEDAEGDKAIHCAHAAEVPQDGVVLHH